MLFKRRISLTCSVISEKTYWTTNFNKNFFKERSTKRAETSTMLWPIYYTLYDTASKGRAWYAWQRLTARFVDRWKN